MKVKKVSEASEKDLAYFREDLINLAEDITKNLPLTEEKYEQQLASHKKSIELDYNTMIKDRDKEDEKDFNKKVNNGTIIASAVSIAGFIGLITAGVLSHNPTFFSVGNMVTAGALPLFIAGLGNYIKAMRQKSKKVENLEQERDLKIANIPFEESEQYLQKEREVNQAWLTAVGDQLGLKDLSIDLLETYICLRKSKEEQKDIGV